MGHGRVSGMALGAECPGRSWAPCRTVAEAETKPGDSVEPRAEVRRPRARREKAQAAWVFGASALLSGSQEGRRHCSALSTLHLTHFFPQTPVLPQPCPTFQLKTVSQTGRTGVSGLLGGLQTERPKYTLPCFSIGRDHLHTQD